MIKTEREGAAPGFKVVWRGLLPDNSDHYRSAWATCEYDTIYDFERWTEPKPDHGPLFVFDTYENANDFIIRLGNNPCLHVMACLYVPDKFPYVKSMVCDSLTNKAQYWQGVHPGTQYAKAVLILREYDPAMEED